MPIFIARLNDGSSLIGEAISEDEARDGFLERWNPEGDGDELILSIRRAADGEFISRWWPSMSGEPDGMFPGEIEGHLPDESDILEHEYPAIFEAHRAGSTAIGDLSDVEPLVSVLNDWDQDLRKSLKNAVKAEMRRGNVSAKDATTVPVSEHNRNADAETFEPYWLDETDWLCLMEIVPTDDEEMRAQAADSIGYLFGYSMITDTRMLALLGDPEGETYELLFSFSLPENRRHFLELVQSNELTRTEDEMIFTPDRNEIEEARPLGFIFDEEIMQRATLIAMALVGNDGTEPLN